MDRLNLLIIPVATPLCALVGNEAFIMLYKVIAFIEKALNMGVGGEKLPIAMLFCGVVLTIILISEYRSKLNTLAYLMIFSAIAGAAIAALLGYRIADIIYF